jgi:hypothetical protein
MAEPRLAGWMTLIGVGFAVLGVSVWWPWLWPACCCAALAVAYGSGSAAIWPKRTNGTLHPLRAVLLAPYLMVAWTVWHLARLRGREAWARVDDGLYVGRRLIAGEPMPPVDVVLDLTAEFAEPRALRRHARYVAFPIADGCAAKAEALAAVLTPLRTETVFIHCVQGHGRTAMVAAALLMLRGHSASQALQELRAVRPGIRLRRGQQRALALGVEPVADRFDDGERA